MDGFTTFDDLTPTEITAKIAECSRDLQTLYNTPSDDWDRMSRIGALEGTLAQLYAVKRRKHAQRNGVGLEHTPMPKVPPPLRRGGYHHD